MSEHCMKVPIVYDWITIDEEIKKCKLIPLVSNVKQLEDCICINFNVNCQSDTPTTIWQAVGDKISAATFSIEHEGTCSCDWVILANDEEISWLSQGNTFSGTVGDLAETLCFIREWDFSSSQTICLFASYKCGF